MLSLLDKTDFRASNDEVKATWMFIAFEFLTQAMPIVMDKKDTIFSGPHKENARRILNYARNMNRMLYNNIQKDDGAEQVYDHANTTWMKMIRMLTDLDVHEVEMVYRIVQKVKEAPEKRQWIIYMSEIFQEIVDENEAAAAERKEREGKWKKQ